MCGLHLTTARSSNQPQGKWRGCGAEGPPPLLRHAPGLTAGGQLGLRVAPVLCRFRRPPAARSVDPRVPSSSEDDRGVILDPRTLGHKPRPCLWVCPEEVFPGEGRVAGGLYLLGAFCPGYQVPRALC